MAQLHCVLLVGALVGVRCTAALYGAQVVERPGALTEDMGRLRNLLPGVRDTWARPDVQATPVNMSLGIKHVGLNEMQSTVSVSAWIRMEWRDARNAWENMSNGSFSHIKLLPVPIEHVWHPDIVLKNSLAGKGASLLDGGAASLFPDGRVVWTPSAMLEAYCQLDLTRWPFEKHVCQLHFGSWTLDNQQLFLDSFTHSFEFPGQTGEFVVDLVAATREERREEGLPKPFDGVVYSLYMHREPGTYRAVVFTPAAVVVILCLSTFLMPPHASEKVILGGVNAMLICLFLIYFAHSLPVLNNETPFVVMFYSANLYMVCASLVVAVVVLNIARTRHARGLPWVVKRVLTGPCGRVLLLNGYIEQMMGVDHGPCFSASAAQDELPVVIHEEGGEAAESRCSTAEIGSKKVSPNLDWLLLAAAIDRVMLAVYALVFIILAAAFHV